MAPAPSYAAPFSPGGDSAVDDAMARRLLSLALGTGGDYADLFFEYDVSGSFRLDEGILKAASRSVTMGLGVRVRKGDATGYAYVQDLVPEAMAGAARTAAQIAAGGGAPAPQEFATPELSSRYVPARLSFDAHGTDKRELLLRADRAARAEDPRVVRVEAVLAEQLREILIATSDGRLVRDRQPLLRVGVSVLVQDGKERQSGSSGGGGRLGLEYFDERSPELHAREAVRQALIMLDARESPAGEMDVVLGPGDSGILLHEAVGHGLEADFNRKGTSNYSGRVGERVASELCTVIDDARLPGARGSINVDDEGNEPACATLIEQGKLVGYMHDRHSAEFFRLPSSGNGRRESFQDYPMPRMTNTILMSGPHEPEEVIRSVKRGVYAKKFGGGQVDISNGDFVFSLTEGYLIEDGKLTAPLKNVDLVGNGPDVMCKVSMLANDMQTSDGIWVCGKEGQSVPVGVGCPTVKISGMTVGGTRAS